METQATNNALGDLLSDISTKKLIPQPDFQRRLVWNNKDKCNFIKTVLEEYPFPEIYLATGEINHETGARTQLIVDGQQRMTTLYQYFKDSPDLILSKDITPYSKLSPQKKDSFLQYSVVIRDLGKLPIEKIKKIFQRINSTSYGLNYMEIENSRYAGAYKQFNEGFSTINFFEKHKFFSPTEIHRMEDMLYCCIITTTVLSTYFNGQKDVSDYLERYDDEFPLSKQLNKEFKIILNIIDSIELDDFSRMYNKADFFTLFVELYNVVIKEKKEINIGTLTVILATFYADVDQCNESSNKANEIYEYYKAALQGSSSRSNRITRGKIIRSILEKSIKY